MYIQLRPAIIKKRQFGVEARCLTLQENSSSIYLRVFSYFSGLSSASAFLKRDISYVQGFYATASFLEGRFIIPPCELSKAISLGFSMLSEKHVYFDVTNTHTRCVLLYVRGRILWTEMWGIH